MEFVKRHKKKVAALVGMALSTYLFVDYIKKKFFEIQSRMSTERTAKQNLRRRFEQNQQDADFTIMALLSSLTTPVMERYPVDQIKAELQSKRKPADRVLALESSTSSSATAQTVPTMTSGATEDGEKSKTQLWQDLKRTTISRAFALVYADALLIFFTRLQLNILGRRNYVNSVVALAQQGRQGNEPAPASFGDLAEMGYFGDMAAASNLGETVADPALDEQYLTFSWWFLNEGWVSLCERIEEAVRRVFDPVSPKAELGFDELSELIGRTQMLIDRPLNPSSPLNFLSQLLPPREQEEYVLAQNPSDNALPVVGPTLRRLLDESADFIESPNAAEVIERLVHSGLSVFMDKLAVTFGATPTDTSFASPYPVVLPTAKVKLPSILANMARQAGGMAQGSPGVENEYIDVMNQVQELTSFSAVVYSSFDWAA